MPGLSNAGRKHIEEQKRTVDQWILDPNIFIKDLPLDPTTKWIKTNNFVQQTISRMLGYDYTNNEWVRMRIDSNGRLEVAGVTTLSQANIFGNDGTDFGYLRMSPDRALWTFLHDREVIEATVLDAVTIASGGAATHAGLDVDKASDLCTFISTDQDCTVYVQGSPDDINWYDLKSGADVDRSWNCNNEKIWFHEIALTRYIRVVIFNASANAAEVSAVIRGQV